ncbi:MAG: hypothetical protein AB2374_12105 [Cytobacillus gottheilii]|uniref:hypothetical protein n=1 Tax=Cytobacillus gottheilii TaxID=859144 RepID=UPI0034640E91
MFSDNQLRDLIAGKIIGDIFPYVTKDEKEIKEHIRRLYYRIKRIHHVECEAEWDHFGSGYASFVEFFCYSKDEVKTIHESNGIREEEVKGIIIDISTLAPVAIMGEDVRYRNISTETNERVGWSCGTLLDGLNSLSVNEEYQSVGAQLKQALIEYDYEILHAREMKRFLLFQAKIPTIYRNRGNYFVMDAIFYWED